MLLVKALYQGVALRVTFEQGSEQIVVLLRMVKAVQERLDIIDDAVKQLAVGCGAWFACLGCQVPQALQQCEIVEVLLLDDVDGSRHVGLAFPSLGPATSEAVLGNQLGPTWRAPAFPLYLPSGRLLLAGPTESSWGVLRQGFGCPKSYPR